jgi:hypothetical protein
LPSRPKTLAGQVTTFLLQSLRPPLRLIAIALEIAYKLLFSWWSNSLLDYRAKKSFVEDIKQAAPFLFAEYGGKVVPEPRPEANDSRIGCICIVSRNLFFRFSQDWRTENNNVRVSPSFAPNDSYDLMDALRVVDPAAESVLPTGAASWNHFARLLEPRIHLLETAFTQNNFSDTKRKIALLQINKVPTATCR